MMSTFGGLPTLPAPDVHDRTDITPPSLRTAPDASRTDTRRMSSGAEQPRAPANASSVMPPPPTQTEDRIVGRSHRTPLPWRRAEHEGQAGEEIVDVEHGMGAVPDQQVGAA